MVSFNVAGHGAPTGTVTISTRTGETCSGPLTNGVGSCSLIFKTTGLHTLTGTYSGDANFSESVSAKVPHYVNGPIVHLSAASLDFGNVHRGRRSVRNLILTNTGNVTLKIGRPTVSGGKDSRDFTAFRTWPISLPPGTHCTIIVTFTAEGDNSEPTGVLTITDSAYGGPQLVPLSATIINP
jgi:hypothetical protein